MWSKTRTYLILLLISMASASVMYYLASQITFRFHDNIKNFCSFINGFEHYRNNIGAVWLPRFFSNFVASLFVGKPPITQDQLKHAVGLYCFMWMLGINLTYAIFWGRKAVYFILGTLACVTFAYTWPIGEMVYPWDLPALFFFTLCIQLIRCRKLALLIIAVCMGMGFKETVVTIPFTLLFWDMPIKRRIKYFCVAMACCLTVKLGIDVFTGNSKILITSDYEETFAKVISNTTRFAWREFRNPIFINTGTLVAFFLLPWRKIEWAYKSVFIVFMFIMYGWGGLAEFRIWFEMIPICLLAFYHWMNAEQPSASQIDPIRSNSDEDKKDPNPITLCRDLLSIFQKPDA